MSIELGGTEMMVKVEQLWRDGKQIPRWQYAQLKSVVGELRIQEGNDEYLRRHLRTAHLVQDQGREVIPPLIDAAVLWIKDNRMIISGFERGDMLPTYAQTWLVELLPSGS